MLDLSAVHFIHLLSMTVKGCCENECLTRCKALTIMPPTQHVLIILPCPSCSLPCVNCTVGQLRGAQLETASWTPSDSQPLLFCFPVHLHWPWLCQWPWLPCLLIFPCCHKALSMNCTH
jgi:hypothetical protein